MAVTPKALFQWTCSTNTWLSCMPMVILASARNMKLFKLRPTTTSTPQWTLNCPTTKARIDISTSLHVSDIFWRLAWSYLQSSLLFTTLHRWSQPCTVAANARTKEERLHQRELHRWFSLVQSVRWHTRPSAIDIRLLLAHGVGAASEHHCDDYKFSWAWKGE